MAAINWSEVRGQKFTDAEAREASDFAEILANFDPGTGSVFTLFSKERLSAARRLVIAEQAPLDVAATMLLSEQDNRIRAVIQERSNVGGH